MTFLLSEDKALRDLLVGLTVTDQKASSEGGSSRSVKVYFGQPDQEVRSQTYPYITIDMVDIAEDFIRSMRGKVKPSYVSDPTTGPDGETAYDSETQDWEVNYPVPVNIDYQITTYARQPRHDREILAQLMFTKIPLRFAVLQPDDGTVRRLDVLDVSKRDVTEQGKRLFVNAITVRVSSEIPPVTLKKLYKVQEVNVTGVTDNESNTDGSEVLGRSPFTAIESFTTTA